MKKVWLIIPAMCCILLAGCLSTSSTTQTLDSSTESVVQETTQTTQTQETETQTTQTKWLVTIKPWSGPIYSSSNLFSSRDLEQEAYLDDATYITVESNQDVTITEEGVYVLQWEAENLTIYVEASTDDKVQLVLNNLSISNTDFPCIYIKSADKTFITTAKGSENYLEVTEWFVDDWETNTNGAIFSKDDITLNGLWTLTINSTKNGIVWKDDLKITWGTYIITAAKKAIDANDSIRISDWNFTLNAWTDALHAENNDDDTIGFIYIGWWTFNLSVGDDALHATSIVQIDDWTLDITASEWIEATYVQINGWSITIAATDDWINASSKSDTYEVAIEITWWDLTITMWAGDTDWIDSNGNLYLYGWTINISARSPADYDGTVIYSWATLIIDGVTYDYVPNQMMWGRWGWNNAMFSNENFQWRGWRR